MSRRDNYEDVAESVPFDNSDNDFTSDNVQDAIEEAQGNAASASRGYLACGYDGNAENKYLEFFGGLPSNISPFIVAEDSTVRACSVSWERETNATVEVYINGTLSFTLQTVGADNAYRNDLSVSLVPGDEIEVFATIDPGAPNSPSRPLFVLNVQVLV